jgi:hypothetical protein
LSILLTDESLSKYPSPLVTLVLDFVSPKIVLSLFIAVFGASLVAFDLANAAGLVEFSLAIAESS